MEFDLENPFTCLYEQYSDTITDLFASESDHMPSTNFLHCFQSFHSFLSFRQQAISLILRGQYHCNGRDPFLSYLAVNYMDRFISSREIQQEMSWVPRLVAISCLSLAGKMKNTHFSISTFQRQEDLFFDLDSINRMELLILDGLNWRMRSITPFSFLHFFVSLFELDDAAMKAALKDRATDVILKALNEIKLLEFKPSIIAASALLVASHELFPLQFPSLRCSISTCERVNQEKLLKCFNVLQEMVEMEWYKSMLDANLWSSGTPLSVLDQRCTVSESCETHRIDTTIACDALPGKTETKRRRINSYCCN